MKEKQGRNKRPGKSEGAFLVAIRLKGQAKVAEDIDRTLTLLGLKRKFNAVLLNKRPEIEGMLRKVKDWVTWGEVGKETIALLLKSRGSFVGGEGLSNNFVKEKLKVPSVEKLGAALVGGKVSLRNLRESGIRPVFRLHPPRGGFRHSIKRPFKDRGELGYRAGAIEDLIKKMI